METGNKGDEILHIDFNLTAPVTVLVPYSSCFKKVGYGAAKEIFSSFYCCSSFCKKEQIKYIYSGLVYSYLSLSFSQIRYNS